MIYGKEGSLTLEAYQQKISVVLKDYIDKYELVVALNIEEVRNLIHMESELECRFKYREAIKKYGYKFALLLFGKFRIHLISILYFFN